MNVSGTNPALIAVDWGTSNCRAFLLDTNGNVLDERRGESGIGEDTPAELKAKLSALIDGWDGVPILMCGMIGSNKGILHAAYLNTPTGLADLAKGLATDQVDGRPFHIVPGLKVEGNDADIMRGEETQLLGLLAEQADYSGLVILPGTHSKWVVVEKGRIEKFCTFMTGELFATLSSTGILRHSLAEANRQTEADEPDFINALEATLSGKVPFLGNLFTIRARDVLEGHSADENSAFLSGLCIGGELHAAKQFGWLEANRPITIIGARGLLPLYTRGLSFLGHETTHITGKDSAVSGLFAIAQNAGLVPANMENA